MGRPDAPPPREGRRAGSIRPGAVEAFLTHAGDLMLLFALDGTITWASQSAQRLFDLDAAALIGRNGFDLIHPDDHERALTVFSGIQELGDQARVELRVVDPSGRVRWVEEVVTNLVDEPDVGGVVAHLRDITERRAAEEAVRFQASLLDAVGQALVAHDRDGITTYWNDAAAALFGWPTVDALGRPITDLVRLRPHDRALAEQAAAENAAGRRWTGEMVVVARDGEEIPVHAACTPIIDDDGHHVGTVVASTDLSEIVEQRDRAQEDRRRLAEAQASASLGSFELDRRTGELIGSDELWRILGRPPSDLARLEHVHPDDLPLFRDALRAALSGDDEVACTHRIVRPDGVVRWVVSRTSKRRTADGDRVAGTVLDITERREAEQALLHEALHDPLTGLANRRRVVDELGAVLDADPSLTGPDPVLLMGLDDFKVVNDRMGHAIGDAAIATVAGRVVDALPPEAIAGRLGGDELVACVTGEHDAAALGARILEAIRQPLELSSASVPMDASIGIAPAGRDRQVKTVLRDADLALHAAKRAGGGRVVTFHPRLLESARLRRALLDDLRTAVEAGDIVPHLQPEWDLRDGSLFGFEALARWTHPTRGAVPPDEFIAAAEQAGLIAELGRQVLEAACAALGRWSEERPDLDLTVGVNLSPLQMADRSLPDDIAAAMTRHGIAPGRLCLEITESALLDPDIRSDVIDRLRDLGVSIAIDDFGTGYSSFSRLKEVAVDFLKIDRSFVADIGQPVDDVILRTMVAMAHSLGMDVIAEGIETTEQHAFLTQAGCELGQGFLWSRPLPVDDATALVRSAPRRPTS